jgi:death on curing protein
MDIEYLGLEDYLLIAEEVLGIEAEVLAISGNLPLAESALAAPAAEFGGVEFYTTFAMKVAVLGSRLARNHPLPDGNKRSALLAMIEFAERNGYTWTDPPEDPEGDETVAIMIGVAEGSVAEEAFAKWVADRIETGDA